MNTYPASRFMDFNINIPWVVDGLLPAYGINLLIADPKVGKSILSVQLARSISAGIPFLGLAVLKPLKVCYIQADEPPQEWAHQLKALSVGDPSLTLSWDTLPGDPGCLSDPSKFAQVKQLVTGYDFLILDALVSLFDYPDLGPRSMGHILKQIRLLFVGPVWLIHHKRKTMPGIPDRGLNATAGGFTLNAGVSSIHDLTTTKLTSVGRVVKSELHLQRTSAGLWRINQNALL